MSAGEYSHGFSAGVAAGDTEGARRTADVLVDVLVDAGVDVVFNLPGGAIAPLHDALLDRPEVRVITTRHESGAMFAAQAYARATGKIGVVLVTSGPGILNAITGLASAHCDGMPLLVLAGEVPRSVFGRQALQEGTAHHLDIVATCRAVSKLSAQVPSSDLAPAMLRRAIATALSGRRGPAVLTLPLDLMSAPIRTPNVVNEVKVSHDLDAPAMRRAMREVAHVLLDAERPLIFAGSGARWGDGPSHLRAFAEAIGAPVMTTPKGKGVFPESHRLSLGVFGYGGHPSATAYVERGTDAILAVGTGLGDVATNGWSPLLKRAKHFVHIDVDAFQIGRNYAVTHGIAGDAGRVLEAMTEIVERGRREPRKLGELGVRRFSDPSREAHGPEGRITPMRALWELQRSMPKDTMYTVDIGEHLLFAIHYLAVDDPNGFLAMTGLGSMGSSIAAAIGARLARPDRPAVAVCGDGCFSMNLGDLAVAARERIPLVVAVLNDERYGMVEMGHEQIYGRTPDYSTGPMNVSLMASSVGADAVIIRRGDELLDVDLAGVLRNRPLVLDIQIDRRVKMPKNGRFDDIRGTVTAKKPN